MVGVEMQFADGNDDTEFENLLVKIASVKDPSESRLFPVTLEVPGGAQKSYVNTRRVPAFIRNVTPVIEALLEQFALQTDVFVPGTNDGAFLFSGTWTQIGGPVQSCAWLATRVKLIEHTTSQAFTATYRAHSHQIRSFD